MKNTDNVTGAACNVTKSGDRVTVLGEDVTEDRIDDIADEVDMFVNAIVNGDPETVWSREIVMDRLEEAIRLVHRTAGRVGPKGYGKSMPDYEYSALDRWFQQEQTKEERERGDFERNRPTRGASTSEIAEAEEALAWVRRFVADERWRKALYSWMRSRALRKPWKKLCRAEGLNYRTATARRDRAVALIVYGLSTGPGLVTNGAPCQSSDLEL